MKQYFSGASRNLEALTNNPIFIQPISQIYFSTSRNILIRINFQKNCIKQNFFGAFMPQYNNSTTSIICLIKNRLSGKSI